MGDALRFLVGQGDLVLFASVLSQQIGLPLSSTPSVITAENIPSYVTRWIEQEVRRGS